jgi:cytochrome c5
MNQTIDHSAGSEAAAHADEAHTGPIKTPKQLIVTVVLAFILPVIIIFLLINLVLSSSTQGAGSGALTPEAIATRIKPVAGFALVDANAPRVFKTGQKVFDTTCVACHGAGIGGAPKMGDKGAWAPFIGAGMQALMKTALEGKVNGSNVMPAKGGNPNLSDFEIERAVVYMANQSGGSFPEPAEPAPAEGGK